MRIRPATIWALCLILGTMMLSLPAISAPLPTSPAPRAEDAPQPGVKSCLRCHEAPSATDIIHGPHGVTADSRTKFGTEGCTTCHGDSLEHMRKVADGQSRPAPSIVFAGPQISPLETRNGTCLTCHENGLRHDWAGSLHQRADLSCADCHSPHSVKDPVLTRASQPEICFTCHKSQRLLSLKQSHHPIREGAVICADCHNPHGSASAHLLKGERVTDTCLGCHAEKRGPFLWEHPPVAEDCTLCHEPHGSTNPTLLKTRMPYLCQNCHDSGAHVSQPFSGANLPGGANPSLSMSLKSCATCHSEVHGSNHPGGIRRMR